MAKKTVFQPIDIQKYDDMGYDTSVTTHMGIPTNASCENIETILVTESNADYYELVGTLENETPRTQQGLTGLTKAFLLPGISISADRLKAALKEHSITVTNDYTKADFIVTDEMVSDEHDSTFRSNKLMHHKTNMYMVYDGPADTYYNRTGNFMIWCDKVSKDYRLHNCDYDSAAYDIYGITGLAIELGSKIKAGELQVVNQDTVINASASIQDLTEELKDQLITMLNGNEDDKNMAAGILPTINYTSQPALLYLLFREVGSRINWDFSRNKDLEWWKDKAKLDTLERKNAEQAIQYFEHHGVLDSRNFKMLEPLCREEISISNRELYSFTVQVKPEWRKYLKKQKNERKGSTTDKN